MHESSLKNMNAFITDYNIVKKKVVDIGSCDINGTYRPLFEDNENEYIGADIIAGPNVDVLIDSPEWQAIKNVDVIVSGQTFEHVEDPITLLLQMMEVLKPGGIIGIIAPSCAPPHHHPAWMGNFSVKRMTAMLKSAGFEIESVHIDKNSDLGDCIGVAKKPGHKNRDDKIENK